MPTSILLPTAEGSETTFTNVGGANKTASVTTNDGDTSYISKAGLSGTSAQTFTAAALPGAAVGINQVTVRHRARRGTTVSPPSAVNGVIKLGADILGPVIGGVYWNRRPEAYYLDFITPDIKKLDLSAWTVANINAAQVGVRLASLNPPNDASEEIRVTYLALEVDWGAGAFSGRSTFSLFVGSLVGAVFGGGLGLEHMPKVAAYLARITNAKHRIIPSEYCDLLLSFRAPRRVYG